MFLTPRPIAMAGTENVLGMSQPGMTTRNVRYLQDN